MPAPEKEPAQATDEAVEETAPSGVENPAEETTQEPERPAVEDAPAAQDAVDSDSDDGAAGEASEAEDGKASDGAGVAADGEGAGEQDDIFTAIKKEVTELRDKYARQQAEWANFRKRTAQEREAERLRASESLVKDLLPVLDDLERALKHAKESGDGGSLTEGVEAIQTKFLQILGKHHVEQIEAQDQPFDAMKHQAVGTQEDESVPEETVIQVYQQGYTMGDKVLRPAMVVTSVGGPAQPPKDEEK